MERTSVIRAEGALARFLVLEGFGPRESRVVAARIIDETGTFSRLRSLSDHALCDMVGLGPAVTERLRAALELAESTRGRRRLAIMVQAPEDVFRWARGRLLTLPHEELWLLALDVQSRLRAARRIAQGGIDAMTVMVRDVLRAALLEGASAFALVHNHPSGDPTPSPADERMTFDVLEASLVVGVPLVDHVVVGTGGFRAIVEATR